MTIYRLVETLDRDENNYPLCSLFVDGKLVISKKHYPDIQERIGKDVQECDTVSETYGSTNQTVEMTGKEYIAMMRRIEDFDNGV